MIIDDTRQDITKCICPECKNSVDLSSYPKLVEGMIIECNHCGMTLLVKDISNGEVITDIVDEGK
jgi:DNA-directed RNA polymerase subunit RPC12/RpoP